MIELWLVAGGAFAGVMLSVAAACFVSVWRDRRHRLAPKASRPMPAGEPTGFPAPGAVHPSPTVGCYCAACSVVRALDLGAWVATVKVAIGVRLGQIPFAVMKKEVVTPEDVAGLAVVVVDAALYERELKPILQRFERGNDERVAGDPRA